MFRLLVGRWRACAAAVALAIAATAAAATPAYAYDSGGFVFPVAAISTLKPSGFDETQFTATAAPRYYGDITTSVNDEDAYPYYFFDGINSSFSGTFSIYFQIDSYRNEYASSSGYWESGSQYSVGIYRSIFRCNLNSTWSSNDVCTAWLSSVYAYTGSGLTRVECPLDGARFTLPDDVKWLCLTFSQRGSSPSSNLLMPCPMFYAVDSNNDDLIAAIENQTKQLMSTSGVDSSVSDAQDSGNSILDSFSGITDAGERVNQLIGGLSSATEVSTVSFPGYSVMGFEVPAATVDVWAGLPELKEPCKFIVTFLFCWAFVHGVIRSFKHDVLGWEDTASDLLDMEEGS